MQTYSLNALAESFEVDRSTMVRALRGVAPDVSKTKNRPQWKTATAARALEAHRRSSGAYSHSRKGAEDQLAVEAQEAFAAFDVAMDSLMKLKTVEQRRAAGRKIGKDNLLANVCSTMLARDLAAGLDDEHAHLRSENVYRLCMQGFKMHCQWSGDEAWPIFNRDTGEEGKQR